MIDRLLRLPMPVLPVHSQCWKQCLFVPNESIKECNEQNTLRDEDTVQHQRNGWKYLGYFLCLGVPDWCQTSWLPAYGIRLFAKLAHPHLMTLYNFGSLI